MDLYLYRLMDFDFEDEDDEEFPCHHESTHIMETRLRDVIPMAYGYFYIGYNFDEIYPYSLVAYPSKPIIIFGGEEKEALYEKYSLVIPYQNKRMAKEIFAEWLEKQGYKEASKAVIQNPVTHLKRMRLGGSVTRDDVSYAKYWDKLKISERNKKYNNMFDD